MFIFFRKFDYFDKCFSPVRENCFNYIQFSILAIYEGHRKAFSYLCRETTDGIIYTWEFIYVY